MGEHRGLVAASLAVALAALPALAETHRALAEAAERTAHFRAAAREYEAAWLEERAPELLFRLGVARRRLQRYAAAREAFRSYLREAPSGALKDDAERQLAQLDVLLDEQRRTEGEGEPAPPRRRRRAREQAAVIPDAPAAPPPAAIAPPPPPPPAAVIAQPPVEAAPPPTAAVDVRPPVEAAPPAAAPLVLVAAPPPAAPLAVPAEAVAAPAEGPRLLAPSLAAGAGASALAGALLWWDGARVSRDLDSRFASGQLSAADSSRYGRAHFESVAGRVLAGVAVCAAAGAVWAWR